MLSIEDVEGKPDEALEGEPDEPEPDGTRVSHGLHMGKHGVENMTPLANSRPARLRYLFVLVKPM